MSRRRAPTTADTTTVRSKCTGRKITNGTVVVIPSSFAADKEKKKEKKRCGGGFVVGETGVEYAWCVGSGVCELYCWTMYYYR